MRQVPLILGGHSYIRQLGSDPKPDPHAIDQIVRACIDQGLDCFDTTYRPERIALGDSLHRLGLSGAARIIAWNFFHMFDDDQDVGGPDYYRPEHLQQILDDAHVQQLDGLVVHRLADETLNERQEELAIQWKNAGHVQRLGLWSPGESVVHFARRNEYDFVVEPFNLTTGSKERIALYRSLGLKTYVCSPYVRGWKLDKMVAAASRNPGLSPAEAQARVADGLLRYALFESGADCLIVSMRKAQWIGRNIESCQRGPLSDDEMRWLKALRT